MANVFKNITKFFTVTDQKDKSVYALDLEFKHTEKAKKIYQVNLIHNKDVIPVKNQKKIKHTII